jgi:hypothetical protein
MGACAEGLVCADQGARAPIGASGNFKFISYPHINYIVFT